MKKINDCIVFSNDIKEILNGNNALDFSYQEKGIILPSKSFIEDLRFDFKKDVDKIFENKTLIISEDEMDESLEISLKDIYGRYPHSFFG